MEKRPLVLDACLTITFGQEQRLDLLTDLPSRRIVIAERAKEEVKRPPARDQLEDAIDSGSIDVETINLEESGEQDALSRYDARPAFRGRGDAEVIALAVTRGYIVGSDDRAIRRQVKNDLAPSRLAGTLDILVWAVRDERLTLDAASSFLRGCDVGPSLLQALEAQDRKLADLVWLHPRSHGIDDRS